MEVHSITGSILIVDDDPAVRTSLQTLLEDKYQVMVAPNAYEAIKLLYQLPKVHFDVIVADYDMPGESGLEFLTMLNKKFPWIIGILLTGYPNDPEVKEARKSQYEFLVLPKTVEPSMLLGRIENAICTSQLRQARQRLVGRVSSKQ